MWTVASSPWPYTVGLVFAFSPSATVERGVVEYVLRLYDEFVDECGSFQSLVFVAFFGSHQQFAPLLVRVVVGRSAYNMFVATFYYKQVSVLYSLYEFHPVAAKFLVQEIDEFLTVVGSEMSTVVVFNLLVGKTNDIATQGEVVGLHFITYGGCFQRSASLVYFVHVVAKDCGICHLATRQKAIGHGNESSCASDACQMVHVWCVGILKEGFASESVDSMISHAVAENNNVFHGLNFLDVSY